MRRGANQQSATPKKRRKPWPETFITRLQKVPDVSAACKAARIDRSTAYRERESNPEFAAQWDAALDEAIDRAEAELHRRAVEGVKKPVYQNGKLVGHIQEYGDTLLIFLLKAHKPEKYRETINNNLSGSVKLEHSLDDQISKAYGDAGDDAG